VCPGISHVTWKQYTALQKQHPAHQELLQRALELVKNWPKTHIKDFIPFILLSATEQECIRQLCKPLQGSSKGLGLFLSHMSNIALSQRFYDFVLNHAHEYMDDRLVIPTVHDTLFDPQRELLTFPKFTPVETNSSSFTSLSLHELYIRTLQRFGKNRFDIYGRGTMVEWQEVFFVPCQLNFYLFLVQNGVLSWILHHQEQLEHYRRRDTTLNVTDVVLT
jgi:hypothetical protein